MSELAPEVTIWTDARTAATAGGVLELMGSAVRPIAVGGPRSAEVGDLARRLGCPAEDDFRKLMVDRPARFVLLTSMDGTAREDLAFAVAQDAVVLALEPVSETLNWLGSGRGRNTGAASPSEGRDLAPSGRHGRVVAAPDFLAAPGWTGAADPLEVMGRPRLLSYMSFGGPGDCSLFARLYDAWRVVLGLVQMPESIDASLVGPLSEVPDDLRGITGHLAAHARLPDNASVVLEVSDRAAPHRRRLRMLGDQGRLLAGDFDYTLWDATGKLVDQKTNPNGGGYVDLVARQWLRLLDRPDIPPAALPSRDEPPVLACCLASLLSARTAQAESPAKLLALQ